MLKLALSQSIEEVGLVFSGIGCFEKTVAIRGGFDAGIVAGSEIANPHF